MSQIKPLAFYLPQFHPIPENDKWWGKGFTEWTNVGKARPLFGGHNQPKVPADLGYYDLRLPEVREQQANLAKEYGIHGFIYYHYWFGNGQQLLERIANEVLESKKPDFPFCFCWANETWSGRWHGLHNKVLAEQEYPSDDDIEAHFKYLLPFFNDDRYIKVDGKPMFIIYRQLELEEKGDNYIEKLRNMAREVGFDDLYIVASNIVKDHNHHENMGYDAKISFEVNRVKYLYRNQFLKSKSSKWQIFQKKNSLVRLDARKMFNDIEYKETDVTTFPMVLPNWDNTPRSSHKGEVFEHTTPKLFEQQVSKAIDYLNDKPYSEKFLVIKSWNEWAEGNYLEPDLVNGMSFLEAIRMALNS